MSKAAEYRRHAQECLQIAARARFEQRLLLVEMARMAPACAGAGAKTIPVHAAECTGSPGPLRNRRNVTAAIQVFCPRLARKAGS